MEKQGFRFIILRVLARRLQNMADFVSRQVVEEERPVLQEQVTPESAGTGSVIDPSRMVSSPESELAGADDENRPALWLTQARTAEPPADRLAHVRENPPTLLQHERLSQHKAGTHSHTPTAAHV